MDGKYGVTRHFFKIMLPGFHDKLFLPPAFCRKLKEENLEHAILRSHRGTMKVNVCKNINGLIYFKEGWKDFAYQNDLSIGDVIVFEHTGGLHFNAIVFDPTACEKQFPEEVNLDKHPEDDEKEAVMDLGQSCNSHNPHFVIEMKPHNASKKSAYLNIPVKFLRSNDLSTKTSAKLRNPYGKTWTVRVSSRKRGLNGIRCVIDKGWYQFYESNKLKDGDVCIFELHSHSPRSKTVVMDVQITRSPP